MCVAFDVKNGIATPPDHVKHLALAYLEILHLLARRSHIEHRIDTLPRVDHHIVEIMTPKRVETTG